MSALILRFLPHLAVVALLGFAIWWVDDNAADRTEAQIKAAALRVETQVRSDLRKSEQRLASKLTDIGTDYARGRQVIETIRTINQPIITREIIREARLSDPDAGVTDGLRDAINAARRATGACSARPDGGIVCALPEPPAAGGEDDRGVGPEGL